MPDFELQNRLVTNAEYLEFMEAGGYQRLPPLAGRGLGPGPSGGLGRRRCTGCAGPERPVAALHAPRPAAAGAGRARHAR
ncbi:MAG: hypothetical protein WKG07_16005 [Hymenobacter sp.]